MPTLVFTDQDDAFVVDVAGEYSLSFLDGNDTLTSRSVSAATLALMGAGDDVFNHRSGAAEVFGEAGNDRFEIYTSGVTADGGADDDLMNIRAGSGLVLAGGLGNDRFNFYGSTDSVQIHGDAGHDDFFGYNWPVTGNIYGDAGDDYFVLFRGSAVNLWGGAGNDIYRADALVPAIFIEAFGEGTDSVQVARGISYSLPSNIENISVSGFSGSSAGSAILVGNGLNNTVNGHANAETIHGLEGNDRLFGKGGDDLIFGGDGNDFVDGGDGIDTLYGDTGEDTLNGRAGNDHMVGGGGSDVYYVDNVGDLVTEMLDAGVDTLRLTVSFYALAPNVENGIQSGTADLSLTGNELDNQLTGNSGKSVLYGLAGNDTIRGGAGDDRLFGNHGDDTLIGGDGSDTMRGGLGSDVLYGSAGSDVFVFDGIDEFTTLSPDLLYADGSDFIDFSAIDAEAATPGNQAFHWDIDHSTFEAGDFWFEVTEDQVGSVSISFFGDVDGDGIADFEFHTHGVEEPFWGNFIL